MSESTPNPVFAGHAGALSRCAVLAWTESAQAALVDGSPDGGVRALLTGFERSVTGRSANIIRLSGKGAGGTPEFHALTELFSGHADPDGAIARTLELPAEDGSALHRKFRTLRPLLLSGPLRKKNAVIVVEDAQRCDESSIRFFDFLLRYGRGERFLLVLCRRPDESGPGTWALGQIGAQDRCHRWEVAASRPVDALAGLSAQARTVATAVAVLDEQNVTRVAALCGLPARPVRIAIDGIRRANLFAGSVLDRSVRSRLLAETPAEELAHLHLRAARVLNDDARPAAEVAPHLGALPRLDERWMIDLALEAAASAEHPATAVAHLARAAAAEPGRLDVRLALAAARLELDPETAMTELRTAAGQASDPRTHCAVAVLFALAATAAEAAGRRQAPLGGLVDRLAARLGTHSPAVPVAALAAAATTREAARGLLRERAATAPRAAAARYPGARDLADRAANLALAGRAGEVAAAAAGHPGARDLADPGEVGAAGHSGAGDFADPGEVGAVGHSGARDLADPGEVSVAGHSGARDLADPGEVSVAGHSGARDLADPGEVSAAGHPGARDLADPGEVGAAGDPGARDLADRAASLALAGRAGAAAARHPGARDLADRAATRALAGRAGEVAAAGHPGARDLADRAAALALAGRASEVAAACARAVVRLPVAAASSDDLLAAARTLRLVDDAPNALRALDRAVADAAVRGDRPGLARALAARYRALRESGDRDGALADIRVAALAGAGQRLGLEVRTALATALCDDDEPAAAEALLRAARPGELAAAPAERHLWLLGLARARAARSDVDGALELLLESGRRQDEDGIGNPVFAPWWYTAALLLAEQGRHAEAAAYAERGQRLAESWPTATARGLVLAARGVAASGTRTVELLAEASRVMATSPCRVEYARTEYLLGKALTGVGDRKTARQHLRQAAMLSACSGWNSIGALARELLEESGGRLRKPRADVLTQREREVAELVAGGASNRDVAGTLFVSPRTVELHLTNVYRKLAVDSRAELAAALRTSPGSAAPGAPKRTHGLAG